MKTKDDIKIIQEMEEKILAESDKIEKLEQAIIVKESKIESEDGEVLSSLKKVDKIRQAFIKKISRHKLLISVITATGVILFWRGIWDLSTTTKFLASPIVALAIGLIILVLINRYSDLG